MKKEWYYARAGVECGPLTVAEVAEMLADAALSPDDLVWTEGMEQWEPARDRPEFFSQLSSAPTQTAATLQPEAAGVAAVPTLNYETPVNSASGRLKSAGLVARILAAILDVLLLQFVVAFMNSLPVPFGSMRGGLDQGVVLVAVVIWIYFAGMECSRFQATLGKRALGIVVTNEYGERIGFGRATARHFGKLLCYFTFGFGLLMIAFTRQSQGLHDKVAGTLVVDAPARGSRA